MVILTRGATQSFLFLMLHPEQALRRGELQQLSCQLPFCFGAQQPGQLEMVLDNNQGAQAFSLAQGNTGTLTLNEITALYWQIFPPPKKESIFKFLLKFKLLKSQGSWCGCDLLKLYRKARTRHALPRCSEISEVSEISELWVEL